MESAAVIPNSYYDLCVSYIKGNLGSLSDCGDGRLTKITWILPAEPALEIVVLSYHTHHLRQDLLALHVRHVINAEAVGASRKPTLPACNWMCSYDRVVRFEIQTYIAGGAAGTTVHSFGVLLRSVGKGGRFVSGH